MPTRRLAPGVYEYLPNYVRIEATMECYNRKLGGRIIWTQDWDKRWFPHLVQIAQENVNTKEPTLRSRLRSYPERTR